ncbi:MAG TPA: PDR/VanB family oxidoreductase [Xanthobacteraceae bacterium]|nr:PDR/VanB family oxidoreductase [Xanthobacteraceae bacterium]
MHEQERLNLVVTEVRQETPLIRAIRLARVHDEPLPAWQAGAHIKVQIPQSDERSYSLINFSADPSASRNPRSYLIGVRLEQPSQGGSVYMHALKPGDAIRASAPTNNFPLQATGKPVVLLAGGIGVTPLISMAAELTAGQHPFWFHYAGRSRDQLALLPAIEELAGSRLSIHTDDLSGLFDVVGLMSSLKDEESLYCCGPMPMIELAIKTAKRLGWREGRLHFEIFTAPLPKAGDQDFDVVLKSSGESFHIPAGKSILDVLIAAGKDPMHDCKRGDCGICQVGVVEGVPDHRDFILTDAEKAAGKIMQICVSRSKTPRLVLDL